MSKRRHLHPDAGRIKMQVEAAAAGSIEMGKDPEIIYTVVSPIQELAAECSAEHLRGNDHRAAALKSEASGRAIQIYTKGINAAALGARGAEGGRERAKIMKERNAKRDAALIADAQSVLKRNPRLNRTQVAAQLTKRHDLGERRIRDIIKVLWL